MDFEPSVNSITESFETFKSSMKLYERHKCTTKGWAFICLIWHVLYGWVWQKAEICFTSLKSILCRSNGSDTSLNVLCPSTVFFFSK